MKIDKEVRHYFKVWQQAEQIYQDINIDEIEFTRVYLSDEQYFELGPKKSEVSQELKETNIKISFVPLEKIDAITGVMDTSGTRNIKDVISGYTYFKDGDVIFTKVTPSMENGNTAIAENMVNGIGFGSSEYYVFRCKGVLNKLIYYFLRTKTLRDLAKPTMKGSGGLKRVPKEFFETVGILLPKDKSPRVQQCLVDFIEKYKAQFNQYRQLISQLKSQVESFDKAFLPAIFSSEKDPFIVEYFDQWSKNNNKELSLSSINFEHVSLFENTKNISMIGSKKLGRHDEIENINDAEGLPVFDASPSTLCHISEEKFPNRVFEVQDEENPDISFASEGNSSAGTNFHIHKGKYFVNNHRTVVKFLTDKFYSKYVYYRLLNMKEEYGFKRGYSPSQSELKSLDVSLWIPKGDDSFEIQKNIVEFIEEWREWRDEMFRRIDKLSQSIDQAEELLIAKTFKGCEE